ncbi:regulator of chromosome condensation [Stylonychia lemnae]|uniref:Regulator of chromosome condensation n=1 Tax=Stylonychia lemnae TaxID=5949 RepID=A0A078AL22_STYLE|nr:regulator of chromosome condensation [Stylonychia lemnae]|eukprot:CDW81553.1 regulator of chromosome condensation [Stylonychia lemnae]
MNSNELFQTSEIKLNIQSIDQPLSQNQAENSTKTEETTSEIIIEEIVIPQTENNTEQQEEIKQDQSEKEQPSKDEAYVLRDRNQLDKMLDGCRIMGGQKTTDQMRSIWDVQKLETQNDDIHKGKVSLPASMFSDFLEVTYENEKDFEYFVSNIMIQFLAKFNDRALEFPEVLDPQARALIHCMCNFIGMRSISVGKSNKNNRKVLIYPNGLFPNVTEKELKRIEKEKQKIREKFMNANMAGIPRENPVTMREKLIREVYFEKKGIKDENAETFWEGPIQVRIDELKRKMRVYEKNLQKLRDKYAQDQAKSNRVAQSLSDSSSSVSEDQAIILHDQDKRNEQEELKADFEQTQSESRSTSSKSQSSFGQTLLKKRMYGDTQSETDLEQMDQDQKQEYIEKLQRIKKQQQDDYLKRKQYHKELKKATLQSFKDRPDEIKDIKCIAQCKGKTTIKWIKPNENNCPITAYKIYLGQKIIHRGDYFTWMDTIDDKDSNSSLSLDSEGASFIEIEELSKDTLTYTFDNLDDNTGYYIKITAVNEIGEGYQGKALYVQTPSYENISAQLFVWGSNSHSQLALLDDSIDQTFYNDNQMRKVRIFKIYNVQIANNPVFERGGILNYSAGNNTSLFLYQSSISQMPEIIQSGASVIAIDESDTRQTFTEKQINEIEIVPSVPFKIDFMQPVVKVSCGSMFSALLTSTGEVYTWGNNQFGQLGINNSSIMIALSPQRVQLEDSVIDIAVGFDQCLALNDSHQVYAWGRKMGIYPKFNLDFHSIKRAQQTQYADINQPLPRLLKENLIYYKIQKLITGQSNCALISQDGDLLIQGLNESGQLAMGQELGQELIFFSDFMKKDYFTQYNLKVLDASYGMSHLIVLCYDTVSKSNRVFGCGSTRYGQLGFNDKKPLHQFKEITSSRMIAGDEVVQISAGSLHSLFLTKSGKLYGCGQNIEGQLGINLDSQTGSKPKKNYHEIMEIDFPFIANSAEDGGVKISGTANEISQGKCFIKIKEIQCGSLYSMALAEKI